MYYVRYTEENVREEEQRRENIDEIDQPSKKGEPVTVKKALARPDGEMWKEAIEKELQSFKENEAWGRVYVL
ncbi:hypothetical protein QE152_g240 [Popillia japonica]|uniref:Uncharacterized protein n=1 Tax=Popillia japonica TaxID=7064 RepID=A0AAW1NCF4_POPJA